MSLQNLDKEKLKLILRTSESFPTQFGPAQAEVIDRRQFRSSSFGHPLSQHLRGAQFRVDQLRVYQRTGRKTKFCSLDDMADALDMVLKTPDGRLSLQQLQPGNRQTVSVRIGNLFDVEGELALNPPQKVKFSSADIAKAGFAFLKCCAVLEGRARGSELYLHVHTFFPEFNEVELTRLLEAKTRP